MPRPIDHEFHVEPSRPRQPQRDPIAVSWLVTFTATLAATLVSGAILLVAMQAYTEYRIRQVQEEIRRTLK